MGAHQSYLGADRNTLVNPNWFQPCLHGAKKQRTPTPQNKKTKTSKNGTRLTKDTITKIGKHTAEPNYLFKMGYSPLITEEWRSVQTHISLSVSNDCITPTVAIWGY